MIRNFFTVAFRNIFRYKGFSFINIAGLTLGVTACLLIGFFVWDEKQYDKFIPDGEKIYRIVDERTDNQGTSLTPRTPPMFATTLQQQFPEIDKTLRLLDLQDKSLFEAGDKKMYEENGMAAEPSFFDIFPLSFKYGSPTSALADPHSIVLTEKLATKYFGNENPIGRQIMIDKQAYIIKGVLDNTTGRFHLDLSYIIPMADALKAFQITAERMESWHWQQFSTYVKLKSNVDAGNLQSRFRKLITEKVHPLLKSGGMSYLPFLQPLQKIHLYSSNFKIDIAVKGNITYVNALIIIAVFILLIACLNFVNLATARSMQRAKEVGVRKSVGASKQQLLVQYTGETVLLAAISVLLSVGLAMLLIPALNQFTGKQISLTAFYQPLFLLSLIAGIFVVGIIAGIYPAFVLSGFQPVKVLKSGGVGLSQPGRISWLRQGLVVIQFSLSVLLIISAMIVFKQVNYLHNKDLGLNKEEIMFFPMRGDNLFANSEAFKSELLQSPGISAVSIGYGFPGDIFAGDNIMVPQKSGSKTYPVTQLMVDHDYVKTLGLQIVAGRDFSKAITTDKDAAYIINETAVKELGYSSPEKAIGQPLQWNVWNSRKPDSIKNGQVIGVVKDFNYKSLYEKVEPAVLQIYPPAYWKVAVKMKAAGIANTVAYVSGIWNKFSADYPIEYKFMDENFERMYKSEDKLKTLLALFTGIAIFVGCLGLFGLAAYSARQRTREIGVRKVLGADSKAIVILLTRDFIRPVLIALVIASPLAWYFLNGWLQDFAYRVQIGWTVFVMAGITAIVIALLTVSFQAVRAAVANPVKALRSE